MTVVTGGAHGAARRGGRTVAARVGLHRAFGVEELGRLGRAHEVEGAVEDHGVGHEIGCELVQGPPGGQPQGRGHAQPIALLGPGVADRPPRAPRRHASRTWPLCCPRSAAWSRAAPSGSVAATRTAPPPPRSRDRPRRRDRPRPHPPPPGDRPPTSCVRARAPVAPARPDAATGRPRAVGASRRHPWSSHIGHLLSRDPLWCGVAAPIMGGVRGMTGGHPMTNGLMDAPTDMPDTQLPEGTPVDVRNRFVGSWSHGFEVAERGGRVPRAPPLRRQCPARHLLERGRPVWSVASRACGGTGSRGVRARPDQGGRPSR